MKLDPQKAYTSLIPRMITLVTTRNSHHGINAIPVEFTSLASFNPPIVMILLIPKGKTYQNIIENKEFVINILGRKYIKQIKECKKLYPEGINKLEIVGLHWYSSEKIRVPRVKEAKAWMECIFFDEKRIGDHILIFGEIVDAEVSDDILTWGSVDLKKIDPILFIKK